MQLHSTYHAEEHAMTNYRWTSAITVALGVGFASFCSSMVLAQTQAVPDSIANNDSIFIDATTFKILPGKANGDASKQIEKLGARELGPGTLIFRSGGKLYIVDTPLITLAKSADQNSNSLDVDEERPNRIRIEYVPPKNPEHQKLYELIKERRVLETLQEIFSPFRLPADILIKTVGCDGVSNAWYQRTGRKPIISLCYEYIQEIMNGMPKDTTPSGLTPADVVLAQIFYAALHELGHAAFDAYDVPVFGREEDAADQFATYMMLQFGKDRARKLVAGAVYSYSAYIKDAKNKPNVAMPLLAFSSNHGSPEERFYNMLCIAYGSDQQYYADLVTNEYLPRGRAQGCRYEYQVLAYAVKHEIRPHVDQEMARKVLDTTWMARAESRPMAK